MNNKIMVDQKRLVLSFINIVFTFFLLFFFLQFNNIDLSVNSPEKIIFPWIVVSLILHIINFKVRKYNFYEFGIWYIILSYFFLFGLVFREVMKLKYSLEWNPITYFSKTDLCKSYFFSLIALNCFSIGYFITKKNKKVSNISSNINNNKLNEMFYLGLSLVLIGGICMLVNDFHIISVVNSYNSYLGYKYAVQSGLLDDLANLFLPGIFLLLFCGKLNKSQKKYIFLITAIYFIFIMMLTGSRKIKLFSLVSLFLGYIFSSKDEKGKKRHINIFKIFIIAVFGILLLNILVIIRDNRFELSNIIPIFMENLFNFNFINDILGEVLSETGLTQLSITSIIKTVPSVFPFQYGMTFVRTIPSFLPIGWLIGDFFYGASSTNIINTYLNMPVGSNLIGDLYWNFGIIGGFISAFVFGIILGKIFNIENKENINGNMAIYFCLFSQLIILVRAEFFDIFRPLVLIYLIYLLLNKTKFSLKGGKSYE